MPSCGGDAAQQVQNRQCYGHRYAVQHIEDQHCGRGGQRQEQLAAPEPGDPAEFREIDQPECGEHHEGTQGGERESGERWTEEQHGEQQNLGGDEGGSWVRLPTASPYRAAATAADGKAGEQPGT